MRRSEQKQLLKDILGETDLSQVRQSTLQGGLLALREQRQRRRARRTLMVTALPLILASVFVVGRSIHHLHPSAAGKVPGSAVALMPKQDSGVKVITDDELFALFPNRSLALVGKPGHQELVFLDHGESSVPGMP